MNVGHIVSYKQGIGGRIVDMEIGSLFYSQNSYVKDIDDPELLADLNQRGAQGQTVRYFVGLRRSELEVCGIMLHKAPVCEFATT
jgi:hypothetical protein